jgi:xanthine dehydrogenase small subunit
MLCLISARPWLGLVTLEAWINAHRTVRGIVSIRSTDYARCNTVLQQYWLLVLNLNQPRILINGKPVSIEGVPVQTTLLDFLRAQGLTGAKEGCAEGECGSCTVAMVAAQEHGSAYRAVNSCLMFVPSAVGREFYTVEALAQNGTLAEVQKEMAAAGGSQCGYCTPGFVMSLFAEQYRPGRTGPCQPEALSGNLCRCTGYRPIRDAVLSVGPAPDDAFRARLTRPADLLGAFQIQEQHVHFARPQSLPECLSLMASRPEAKLISGSTDVSVESNLKFRRWSHLVSLEAVAELQTFSESETSVLIGSALQLSDLERRWSRAPPILGQWLAQFASLPIRNRATLGGSLATASPIGDAAPMLMALNAKLHLSSVKAERTIPLSDFFTGYRQTSLRASELIRSIEIPKPLPVFSRFYKTSKRRVDDISIVSAGLAIDLDQGGRIARATFVFGGVGATAERFTPAVGELWNEESVRQISRELDQKLHPIDDHRGSAAYRSALAKSFVEKFYWEWQVARDEH